MLYLVSVLHFTFYTQAHGMHDLRTRKSGSTVFIQLHLELDDSLPLIEAHRISDEVEGIPEPFKRTGDSLNADA